MLTRLQDVAEQIRFLAMSRSITGVNTVIDAGFSLKALTTTASLRLMECHDDSEVLDCINCSDDKK